jgi:hypothetical protein
MIWEIYPLLILVRLSVLLIREINIRESFLESKTFIFVFAGVHLEIEVPETAADPTENLRVDSEGWTLIDVSETFDDVDDIDDAFRWMPEEERERMCHGCQEGGDLIECCRCNWSWHRYCLSPQMPEDEDVSLCVFSCCTLCSEETERLL